jgi:Ferritin-like
MIHTLKSLHEHLQWALELEHSTIPPYLCALYSLHEGSNAGAAQALRAVVMEEMLHMVLVANVLNAVGGEPKVDHPKFVPEYPTTLPHSDGSITLHLQPFSPAALDTFLAIERPKKPHAKPEAHRYHSIGQFYDAIEDGLKRLSRELGESALFSGSALRQVDPTHWYYGGGGAPVLVSDLKSALVALDEIKSQGEGLSHSIFDGDAPLQPEELAHYFRFEQLRLGRYYQAKDTPRSGPTGPLLPVDWAAVHPMRIDPKAAAYRDQPEVHAALLAFNQAYSSMLRLMHQAFNGQPALLFNAVPAMYTLKYQAIALMKVPSAPGGKETVGPSFEYTE